MTIELFVVGTLQRLFGRGSRSGSRLRGIKEDADELSIGQNQRKRSIGRSVGRW